MTTPVLPSPSFPGTLKVFPTRVDGQVVYGEHMNEVQQEVVAVEQILGVNPEIDTNGRAYLTVSDRITFLEDDTVRLEGNQTIGGTKNFSGTLEASGYLIANNAPVTFEYTDRRYYFDDAGIQGQNGSGAHTDLVLQPTGSQVFRGGFRMWDAGNDGPGSGLDADTLDGHQATDFLLRSGVRVQLGTDQVVPHENVGDVVVDNFWRQLNIATVTYEQYNGDGTRLFNSTSKTFHIDVGMWICQWYLAWQQHPNGLRTIRGIDATVPVNASPAATNFTTVFGETKIVNLPSYWPTSGLPAGYYLDGQQNSQVFIADHAFDMRIDVWCGSDADATLLATSASHLHQPTSISLAQIA